jgi:hypothetical protein
MTRAIVLYLRASSSGVTTAARSIVNSRLDSNMRRAGGGMFDDSAKLSPAGRSAAFCRILGFDMGFE